MAGTVDPSAAATGTPPAVGIEAWEDDPFGSVLEDPPPANQPIARSVPDMDAPGLPVGIAGAQPAPPAPYQPGTADFRYWTAADALARGSHYWSAHVPPGTTWQASNGPRLMATLDQAVDLNAYYDRHGLHFFHGDVRGHRVFSGESPDVVCHELGHAVLDAVKPELWNAASIEVAAFHESFGDISAILSNLQLPELREAVLAETDGRFSTASRLSRLAESLGWAIRQLAPDGVDHDCLRSAVNSFYYQDPATLPPSAPATALSSEPHSFSRVFTASFFAMLGGMYVLQAEHTPDSLLAASDDAGRLLIEAVRRAPVVPAFYSQVAAHMVEVDSQLFRGKYRRAIAFGFVNHGVLSVRSAAAVGTERALAAAPEPADEGLAELALDGVGYGLERDLLVSAASQPRRYAVAGGVPDTGDIQPPAPDAAASSFVEDLFRRGRIDAGDDVGDAVPLRLGGTKTHAIEARDGAAFALTRMRFDCGFGGD